MRSAIITASVSLTVLALAAPAAEAQFEDHQMKETKSGILQGKVLDVDGNPIVGLRVGLEQITAGRASRPFYVKTNKKGEFLYPRLDLAPDGYKFTIDSDELLIYQFHVKTRTGQGVIYQDLPGTLTPDAQDLFPKIDFRLGNATIYLKLATRPQFQEIWRAKAAEQAGESSQTAAAESDAMLADAVEAVDPAVPLTPLQEAQQAFALGDFAAAAGFLETAIAESPDDADLHWMRAEALLAAQDTGGAIREAQRVIALDPERPGVRKELVLWMKETGNDLGTLPLLEKERELSPDDLSVVKMLAEAYEQGGRDAEYRETLADWESLAPDDPELLLSLAGIAIEEGNFARSEELYARLAAADPRNAAKMFLNVGVSILNKPGRSATDTERAISAFERAIEANPDYARPHFELAIALLGKGDNGGAKSALTRFLELAHPSDPNVATAKGLIDAL